MSSAPRIPGVDQVRQLPGDFTRTIPAEFEDSNGHMNVVRFFELQTDTTSVAFERIGFPDPDQKYGVFSMETRTRHHAEVMVGEKVVGHHRLVAFDGRFFHGGGFLVSADKDRVVSSYEYLMAAVDLTDRRVSVLPEEFHIRIAAEIERSNVGWDLPHFDRIVLKN